MSNEFSFANNVSTTLSESISATSTVLNVSPGTGATFPTNANGQIFSVTLVDSATGLTREICYCTSRSGDALTVLRGQENTTSRAWSAGDTAAHYITAGAMGNFLQPDDISDYATQSWVQGLGYATQSWVEGLGYATQNWVNSQGYATQSWVNSQNYMPKSGGTFSGDVQFNYNVYRASAVPAGEYGNSVTTTKYVRDTLLAGTGLPASKASNGYITLPGGFLAMSGSFNSGNNGNTNIVFPINFPNYCMGVWITEQAASGTWFNGNPTLHAIVDRNTNNFNAYSMVWDSGSWTGRSGISVSWFAIGY